MEQQTPRPSDDVWRWQAESARSADASARAACSWVPPVEEELVRAAEASALRRWYPSVSHTCLRFADGPAPWQAGGQGDVRELPGWISFAREDPAGAAVFRVWSGRPFGAAGPELVLTTPRAAAAVEALVRLLAAEG
ncbi:hypothetical protein [Streptomyces genisteinicus]|uniref:Uncharacterized protein n=1 Tax=Streptomyces genisteinicus TaxID=2768068 RepID=A0A7H0HZG6_9ACTN|nr:hypothetical protein [Streptomyces genisteinicus]QNP65932.1 hypothetical protein IAG43_25405 [Streptomyces genisteinicus]